MNTWPRRKFMHILIYCDASSVHCATSQIYFVIEMFLFPRGGGTEDPASRGEIELRADFKASYRMVLLDQRANTFRTR